ncbi:12020_t:CDS:2 [Gigaspora rosea]|nr:12020_t:CDS:2 [Gigaspora rosea]
MHAVYSTLKDIIPEDIALEDIALEDIAPEDITEDITEEITPAATQNNYNQASYEFHAMQVKCVHEKVVQNDETIEIRNKVAIAPNFDNNQKMKKRKLDQTCSITRKVVSICSNNKTVRVEVEGEVKNFAAKNLKKLHE